MQLTLRQKQILNLLIEEYLESAEPVSSSFLKQKADLNVSPATIRNDLQELTQLGYVIQPHTSAGRVPTEKGYQYFIEITFHQNKIPDVKKEIDEARQKIERELELAKELTRSLQEISARLNYQRLHDKNHILEIFEILGPSRTTYQKNISLIEQLLRELENF